MRGLWEQVPAPRTVCPALAPGTETCWRLGMPFTTCVSLSRLVHLSEPRFSHLYIGSAAPPLPQVGRASRDSIGESTCSLRQKVVTC